MPPLPTPLDEHLYDPTAQMIKVILPYMDVSSARMMAVLAKFLEIKRTIIFFNKPYFSQNICKDHSGQPEIGVILSDLKKYCDGPHLKIIDMLSNALQMGKMYEKFKDMQDNPMMQQLFRTMSAEFEKADSDSSPESKSASQAETPKSPNAQGGSSMNLDQIMNQLPPDMLKNVDMNKFNQMLSALQSPDNTPTSTTEQTSAPPNVDALKSMLTPEQKKMFENLSQNLFKNK